MLINQPQSVHIFKLIRILLCCCCCIKTLIPKLGKKSVLPFYYEFQVAHEYYKQSKEEKEKAFSSQFISIHSYRHRTSHTFISGKRSNAHYYCLLLLFTLITFIPFDILPIVNNIEKQYWKKNIYTQKIRSRIRQRTRKNNLLPPFQVAYDDGMRWIYFVFRQYEFNKFI